jgi:hypothetical protein
MVASVLPQARLDDQAERFRDRRSPVDPIMLTPMSATEFTTLDRILRFHEEELIEETLAVLPQFIRDRQPRIMFENAGYAILRWLMFGRPPRVEWLELSALSYYVLTERFVDGHGG